MPHIIRNQAAALVLAAVLAAIAMVAPEAVAQNSTIVPPALPGAPQTIAPFSSSIGCEVSAVSTVTGWQNRLFARNTLAHALPRGTRLSWTYERFSITTMSDTTNTGSIELSAPVGQGERVGTGVSLGSSQLDIKNCEMRARYGGPRR